MKNVLKLVALLMVIPLAGCIGNEQRMSGDESLIAAKNYSVSYLGINDNVLAEVKGEQAVKEIENILNDRRIMTKKILPVFDTKIIVARGEVREEWLFVKPNYLKLNSKKESTIYELNQKVNLVKVLESMQEE
jgi:hypothetical protein